MIIGHLVQVMKGANSSKPSTLVYAIIQAKFEEIKWQVKALNLQVNGGSRQGDVVQNFKLQKLPYIKTWA